RFSWCVNRVWKRDCMGDNLRKDFPSQDERTTRSSPARPWLGRKAIPNSCASLAETRRNETEACSLAMLRSHASVSWELFRPNRESPTYLDVNGVILSFSRSS